MSILTCLADCVFSRGGECARPSLSLDSTLSDFHDPHYIACPHYVPAQLLTESEPEWQVRQELPSLSRKFV